MEEPLTGIAPIGERGVMQPDDSVATRMFRIAGLFRECGRSSLLLKPCLSWIDMWRTGKTPFDRPPLEPPALESGRRFPFV
eukprot:3621873-Alexandrium_andersonii.AAC.1